jgi:hypothetical protein
LRLLTPRFAVLNRQQGKLKERLPTRCLLVMKSPIDFAQLSGIGNRLFECGIKRKKKVYRDQYRIFRRSHYGLHLQSTIEQSKIRGTVHIMNRHLIVLAALVGREQRTAVLLGQVGYGLNKRHSSHTNFKNIILRNFELRSMSCCAQVHYKNLLLFFFKSEASGK